MWLCSPALSFADRGLLDFWQSRLTDLLTYSSNTYNLRPVRYPSALVQRERRRPTAPIQSTHKPRLSTSPPPYIAHKTTRDTTHEPRINPHSPTHNGTKWRDINQHSTTHRRGGSRLPRHPLVHEQTFKPGLIFLSQQPN